MEFSGFCRGADGQSGSIDSSQPFAIPIAVMRDSLVGKTIAIARAAFAGSGCGGTCLPVGRYPAKIPDASWHASTQDCTNTTRAVG